MGQSYRKPLPLVDEDAKAFWEAAKRHELLLYRCAQCNNWYTQQFVCHQCNAKTEPTVASGKGKVFTWVVFHQLYHPTFQEDIPYNVTMVELEEGPLYMTNLVNTKNADIHLGMPVEVVFDDVTEEISLPKFQPLGR